MAPAINENVTVNDCQATISMPIYGKKILEPINIKMIDNAGFK